MADDIQSQGVPFTNKEMWVRVDAKLDTLVSRQQHFDVELALLKERQHQQEVALAAHHSEETVARERVADALKVAEDKMAVEVRAIKEGQISVGRLVKYVGGVVAALIVLSDALVRFLSK